MHFLDAEGLAQCLIIYQTIIILMACSCVYKKYTNSFKMYTVNRLLNPNLDLDELFIESLARSDLGGTGVLAPLATLRF